MFAHEDSSERQRRRFEETVLPHLDAAYNLARWLARDAAAAEEIVQIASVRAIEGFGRFRGVNPRAWLLTIVRNAFYSSVRSRRGDDLATLGDDDAPSAPISPEIDAEARLVLAADLRSLRDAIRSLPEPFREVLVLRELEAMSYREIAEVAEIPVGTVMSRLARARRALQERLGVRNAISGGRR